MIDVTVETFEAEVIAASMTTPVLVDFWAPWCGPCKTLGPLLEKMEEAYGGRFKLVKIDSDQEQQLAAAFGIRSIPTCVLLKNGQPVDGFMGALPEGQVKQFLDKHLPAAEELQAMAAAEEAQQHLQAGDEHSARAALEQALATDPGNDDARFDLVKLLIGLGELAEAVASDLANKARVHSAATCPHGNIGCTATWRENDFAESISTAKEFSIGADQYVPCEVTEDTQRGERCRSANGVGSHV